MCVLLKEGKFHPSANKFLSYLLLRIVALFSLQKKLIRIFVKPKKTAGYNRRNQHITDEISIFFFTFNLL